MPKKKSVKKAAQTFVTQADELNRFCDHAVAAGLSEREVTLVYEVALVKLEAAFEHMILHALVGAVNNNTALLSTATGTQFPKHLTDEVCEYIVTGGNYFNFRGRDGLIQVLKRLLEDEHYLVKAIKDEAYRSALERLFALRNFAAHESAQSKRAALKAIGQQRAGSAGAWLKRQNRYRDISDQLKKLAKVIENGAPY